MSFSMNLQSAQGAVLVSESRTPSSFDFKDELLTLIATEKKKLLLSFGGPIVTLVLSSAGPS